MLKSEFLRRGDRFFNIHYKAQKLNHKRSNTSTNIKIKKIAMENIFHRCISTIFTVSVWFGFVKEFFA